METRELICIGCPLGCPLTASVDGQNISVKGNTCKRGEDYAGKEILNPSRTVTSSIHVDGGEIAMVSVKTAQDIPKGKIMDVMKEIRRARVSAPVHIGDILIDNCAGTGVAIVATKQVEQGETTAVNGRQ